MSARQIDDMADGAFPAVEEAAAVLAALPEEACACAACVKMCRRPCWPSPAEAARIIDAGHARRLMVDRWCGDGEDGRDVEVLCGAEDGREGLAASFWPTTVKGCVFLTAGGMCELHDAGLKPVEARVTIGCRDDGPDGYAVHRAVAAMWNSADGRTLVERWRAEIGAAENSVILGRARLGVPRGSMSDGNDENGDDYQIVFS